ncbi:hypothetical protein C8F01DRAFT_1377403 [Mycena amicta]|nr:hypothetical protein C8F01DRAFT_1377403 [Mycena amicta]
MQHSTEDLDMYNNVCTEHIGADRKVEQVKVDKEYLDLTDRQNRDFRSSRHCGQTTSDNVALLQAPSQRLSTMAMFNECSNMTINGGTFTMVQPNEAQQDFRIIRIGDINLLSLMKEDSDDTTELRVVFDMRASTFFVLLAQASVLSFSSGAAVEEVIFPRGEDSEVFYPRGDTPSNLIAPGGHVVDPARIFELPSNSSITHVGDRIHVHHPNGTLLHDVPNHAAPPQNGTDIEKRLKTGWVAYESYTAKSPIQWFKTYWKVPSAPKANNGQLLYFFNGMQPSGVAAIIQPVLQYGVSPAGGGNYWAAASWYVGGGHTFHTKLVKVSVGQAINGVIKTTSHSGSKYSYNSIFTNVAGTSLNMNNIAQLTWLAESFEAYNLKSKSNYPASTAQLTLVDVLQINGKFPAIKWSGVADTADGVHFTVTQSCCVSTIGKMTITF